MGQIWVVYAYKFNSIFASAGHRVEIHKITLPVGNERGDIEIKDYVILPRENRDRWARTLILDLTLAYDHQWSALATARCRSGS